jgi:hypothetical protein
MREMDEISSANSEPQASEEPMRPTSPEIRRGIVERVIARLEARGASFERDPQFLVHVEAWVEGNIDMQELRARYLEFSRARWAHRPDQKPEDELSSP